MAFPGKPQVFNLTLTSADTEYSLTLPENTYKVMMQARGSADVKFSYVSGESGSTYFTVKSGQTYWDDNINTASTMYVQSGTASTVVEVLTWTGA
jgi:hypothetical protein